MARRKAPLVWFEIPVTNFDAAEEFYGQLFGWKFLATEQQEGPYRLIDAGEESIDGGLSLRPPGAPPPGFGPIFFVEVPDLEVAIIRAQRLGGKLAKAPLFLSRDAGVVAWIADLDGNSIGLWSAE